MLRFLSYPQQMQVLNSHLSIDQHVKYFKVLVNTMIVD